MQCFVATAFANNVRSWRPVYLKNAGDELYNETHVLLKQSGNPSHEMLIEACIELSGAFTEYDDVRTWVDRQQTFLLASRLKTLSPSKYLQLLPWHQLSPPHRPPTISIPVSITHSDNGIQHTIPPCACSAFCSFLHCIQLSRIILSTLLAWKFARHVLFLLVNKIRVNPSNSSKRTGGGGEIGVRRTTEDSTYTPMSGISTKTGIVTAKYTHLAQVWNYSLLPSLYGRPLHTTEHLHSISTKTRCPERQLASVQIPVGTSELPLLGAVDVKVGGKPTVRISSGIC
jgi:hypothetical protein